MDLVISGQRNELAIILSTLIVALLVTPLRSRIQDVIDRRLYRRKYNAEKTLAQFNQALRDEVNLEQLGTSLTSVVYDTMQPVRVSLWLPGDALGILHGNISARKDTSNNG